MNLDIGWIDWCLLGMLAASVLIGALRGFAFEALSLAGWVVAWFAAQWAAPFVAPHLPIGKSGPLLNQAAAFACVFVLVLIVWSLLSRLVRSLVHATPLRAIDRMLGAAFGLLRGVIVLVVMAAIVGFTPVAKSQLWQDSRGAAWLNSILRDIKPLLPTDAAPFVPA